MPNTREKLIELIERAKHSWSLSTMIPLDCTFESWTADHLIANGVTIPVLCQNCTHHDTEDCPQNRVWCKMLRRYMKLDGYCSLGERKEK